MNIAEIKPYPKNAKEHPKKQVEQMAASIKEFGFNQPIVVDKDKVIIVGHGRYEAAKLLGLTDIPVQEVNLTEEQAKAYRLADNKLNESSWDMGLALEDLKELPPLLFDLTGFDRDLLIEPDEADDIVPGIPEEAKSKLGDLYELGSHRVLCGDSTKAEDVARLMDGKKADMVFTSPPYSDMRDYNNGKDLSVTYLSQFIPSFAHYTEYQVVNLGLQRKDGAVNPYWDEYTKSAKSAGYKMLAWNIWSKRGMGGSVANMTAMFPIEHEWIFVYGVEPKDIKRTKENKSAGLHTGITNRAKDGTTKRANPKIVQQYGKIGSVFEHVYGVGKEHPAVFPVGLVEEYIKAMTEESVIDPFLGSGSTLIAAQKTNRICYGMELDPKYVDVIVQRYVDYVDNPIVKKNGQVVEWEKTVK